MVERKAGKKQSGTITSLCSYHLLGASGLRVSPLCLGTMTFGNSDWGHDDKVAEQIFMRYLEAGGNFIDTADLYSMGKSEELLGAIIKRSGNRQRIVLATKFHFNAVPSDPNAGGNGRKHIIDAIHNSLRRLQTDYIDLYWMHAWDTLTPVEEIVSTLDNLVRQGKIRHYGFSDTPAWYVGKAHGLAAASGLEKPIALQLEYSLVVRDIEMEFVPAAQNLGLGICPWSPLAGGLLTGKYKRGEAGRGRLEVLKNSGNPVFDKLTKRNFDIADKLVAAAAALNIHPAQLALNWVATRPGVSSTIIGATSLNQLEINLQAMEFSIPVKIQEKLDKISTPQLTAPYMFFAEPFTRMGLGTYPVAKEPRWFR